MYGFSITSTYQVKLCAWACYSYFKFILYSHGYFWWHCGGRIVAEMKLL